MARTALITGCSSGFGLGIAKALHARGWKIIGCARNVARLESALPEVELRELDLNEETKIIAAAAGIERLDCLINNAGYGLNGPFSSYSFAQMQRQMQVNFLGPALLTQQLLPALTAAKGRIINISSLAGELGLPMNSMYCASKYAMEGWIESLRHELTASGVQVALVEPGGFRTRFADNIEWGEHVASVNAVDAQQLAGYRALQAKILSRPGIDAQIVVDVVVRLAESATVPLRTRVGKDANGVHWLKRLSPENTASNIVGLMFRRSVTAAQNK